MKIFSLFFVLFFACSFGECLYENTTLSHTIISIQENTICQHVVFGDNVTIKISDGKSFSVETFALQSQAITVSGGTTKIGSIVFTHRDNDFIITNNNFTVISCNFGNRILSFTDGSIFCETMSLNDATTIRFYSANLIVGHLIVEKAIVKIEGSDVIVLEETQFKNSRLDVQFPEGYKLILSKCQFEDLELEITSGLLVCK